MLKPPQLRVKLVIFVNLCDVKLWLSRYLVLGNLVYLYGLRGLRLAKSCEYIVGRFLLFSVFFVRKICVDGKILLLFNERLLLWNNVSLCVFAVIRGWIEVVMLVLPVISAELSSNRILSHEWFFLKGFWSTTELSNQIAVYTQSLETDSIDSVANLLD